VKLTILLTWTDLNLLVGLLSRWIEIIMTFDSNWLKDKVEPVARMMTAEKMGLVKDKYGENQPYELWSQCIPDARKYLGLE
jgi:hypothetical protein